jgi:hypothetical protein
MAFLGELDMSVSLSKDLLPQPNMTRQQKFQVMQNRRTRLVEIAKGHLVSSGYTLGGSLKVPGAHAFETSTGGKSVRVGIKTSADRWMGVARDGAGGYGMLERIDRLFVITTDDWTAPKRVEIYQFDPKKIIAIASTVYEEADRLGHTGLQFLPLDEDTGRRPSTTKSAANLIKHGTLVFDEAIIWDDEACDPVTVAETTDEEREAGIMERIKAMLADHMGVRPELIEIDVRVKL